LFASLLLGFLLGKESFQSAVELAVSFTSKAIERTIEAGYETRHGISVSPVLVELAKR
jgi:pyridoxine kinase